MDTVLRRLGLKKEGRDSEARKRLQKELFAFSACSDHGFVSKPTALAYDPLLSLLAVGSASGAVNVYGKPGVYFSGQHDGDVGVRKLCFLPEQGRLLTLCDDNSLHLWEVNAKDDGLSVLEHVKSFAMENSKLKMVSSYWLTADASQMVLGTDGGNVHFFDIESFTLTEKVLYQDVLIQNAPEDFKVNPGSIEAVMQHPGDSDKLLIGYQRGLIVLWDLTNGKPDHTYNASQELEGMAFNASGSEFVSVHSDGSYSVWNTSDSSRPKENANTPYGPFPCKAITAIDWKTGKTEPWMIFSGGMPRASFGDRHTVSVWHGRSHVTYDFASRVVDFISLPKSADTSETVDNEPSSVLVLTEDELVAVDLTSDGWPQYRLPYLVSLRAYASVTCMQHVHNVPETLFNSIVSAGNSQFQTYSTKEWPVMGGQLGEWSKTSTLSILLTGHADGSVRFWDVHLRGGMNLLYTLTTSSIFTLDTVPMETTTTTAHEDEWPPFKKVGISSTPLTDERLAIKKILFCSLSEKLLLGGASGQVIVLKFETSEGERQVTKSSLNIVEAREDFVWSGPEALTVNESIQLSAGYQPTAVIQLNPPAACSTLAADSVAQVLAVGTSYGFGVFDVIRMLPTYVNCLSLPTAAKLSRSRSFQKSLRESFRQLRRLKSESDHGIRQKSESEPKEEEPKPEVVESTEPKPDATEKEETKVEVEEKTEEKVEKIESPKTEEVIEKKEEPSKTEEVIEKIETKTEEEAVAEVKVDEPAAETKKKKVPTATLR